MPSVTVSAIIDHTGRKYVVLTPPETEKTADFLLTQLYHVLREVKLAGRADSSAPRLVLHSDSGPENANYAFISFCSELVDKVCPRRIPCAVLHHLEFCCSCLQGWFKTTEITRLIVGHTHEAIDAFFRVRLSPCPCALLSCLTVLGSLCCSLSETFKEAATSTPSQS
jgi:hypothetical protein